MGGKVVNSGNLIVSPAAAGQDHGFESLKQFNSHGREYWSARDLQARLGYSNWKNFKTAIGKSVTSCEQSGNVPDHHFADADKPISGGKGAVQVVADYQLSRFACYLIAQNGDPRKQEIALAQKYFAIQTRRQELSDQLAADVERLELREEAGRESVELSGAARRAGVQNNMFGVFHDAGYKGLYNGLGVAAIKRRKGIPDKDDLLDRMDAGELAPNVLVKTQTKEQLGSVNGQQAAIDAHRRVGSIIRRAITEIGGTMPEDMKPAEHIKEARKRIKKAVPKVTPIKESDARGLLGPPSPPKGERDPFDDL